MTRQSRSSTRPRPRFSRVLRAGTAAVLAVTVTAVGAGTAFADPVPVPVPTPAVLGVLPPVPSVPVSAFYTPPSPLPKGRPGDVIRREDLPPIPGASVRRIMYLSTNQQGKSAPVTAVVLTPSVATRSPGPEGARPVVVHSPATRGPGDSCAPSNFYDPRTPEPRNIEAGQVPGYVQQLAAGITVVVTDYLGGGTPLPQEYLAADSAARNGIDALRAVLRLDPNDDLTSGSPAGFLGFSQGGQAAARTAEVLPSYGADVAGQVKGVVAGAPPTDMKEEAAFTNGNPTLAGVGLAILLGLDTAFPHLMLDRYVTLEGRKVLDRVRTSCAPEQVAGFGTIGSDDVTMPDVLTLPDWQQALGESKLGTTAPRVPTYLFYGTLDTVVPPYMAPRLHDDWCAKGARSELVAYRGTEHFTTLLVVGVPAANQWLLDRLSGQPVQPGCRSGVTPLLR